VLPRKRRFTLILVVGLLFQLGLPGFVPAHDPVDHAGAPGGDTGVTDESTDEGEDSAMLHEAVPAFPARDRAARSGPVPADGSGFGTTVYRPPMPA